MCKYKQKNNEIDKDGIIFMLAIIKIINSHKFKYEDFTYQIGIWVKLLWKGKLEGHPFLSWLQILRDRVLFVCDVFGIGLTSP